MEGLIIIAVIGVFVWIIITAQITQKRVLAQTDAFRTTYAGWQLFVSDDIIDCTVLGVGADQRKIVAGPLAAPINVAWHDITRVEVERNGTAVTTTNRGSQIVGAAVGRVLLGPMGLLVGGLTGSKSTQQRVNDLALKIFIEHPNQPVQRIVFFKAHGSGVSAGSNVLIQPGKRLDHFHALLVNAMRTADREHSAAKPPHTEFWTSSSPTHEAAPTKTVHGDIESQISQLWQLHQAGVLTEEEFRVRTH